MSCWKNSGSYSLCLRILRVDHRIERGQHEETFLIERSSLSAQSDGPLSEAS